MYCIRCGSPIAEDAKYCTYCGFAVEEFVQTDNDKVDYYADNPEIPQNPPPIYTQENYGTVSFNGQTSIISLITGIVGIVCAVLYFIGVPFINSLERDLVSPRLG